MTYRAGIVLLAGSKVLLVKIVHNNVDVWGFPKGRMRKGDTPKDTAEREFLEETGIPFKLDGDYRHIRLSNAHFYITNTPNAFEVSYQNVPDKREVKGIQWMDLTEVQSLPAQNINRYVRMYIDRLKRSET
jgi:8-oxo-dGTP pyrophosphatase MutT (NUDIX family)